MIGGPARRLRSWHHLHRLRDDHARLQFNRALGDLRKGQHLSAAWGPTYAAAELPLVTALPFVALLFAIALAPLAAPHWWHHNRNKALVALLVSAPVLVYLGIHAPELLPREVPRVHSVSSSSSCVSSS